MTNKEFITKLNNLQKTAPDATWLKSNRELLLMQISNSGAENLSVWKTLVINFFSLAKASVRPAYALGVFVLVLIFGSLFSNQIFARVKPNDSLYIARIISEKAKLNTILNSDSRDKLAAQFATQHAQEISAVLADPKFNTDQNKNQVASLSASFNQEIKNAKNQLSHLTAVDKTPIDGVVVIADNAKDNNGMQIAVNPLGQTPNYTTTSRATSTPKEETKGTPLADKTVTSTLTSTSTGAATSTPVKADSSNETTEIYDQAQKLFDQKNYDQALNKLKEADQLINAAN